jgi:LPXTG-motif cell wall-anchored protein
VNRLATVTPWLAVIGLVGCVAAVVVVARKRRARRIVDAD